ncbi:MAG: DUF29 domain-containing protein [Methylococcaceae bacterium]
MKAQTLYEKDFYAWALQNAALLKAKRFDELDFEHLVEELESMGKSEGRELNNRLKELLMHLLKWHYQPARQSRSWLNSINKQRIGIDEVLDENPSLKYELEERFQNSYKYARRYASTETQLPLNAFPEECPYRLQDALNGDFFPINQ